MHYEMTHNVRHGDLSKLRWERCIANSENAAKRAATKRYRDEPKDGTIYVRLIRKNGSARLLAFKWLSRKAWQPMPGKAF